MYIGKKYRSLYWAPGYSVQRLGKWEKISRRYWEGAAGEVEGKEEEWYPEGKKRKCPRRDLSILTNKVEMEMQMKLDYANDTGDP